MESKSSELRMGGCSVIRLRAKAGKRIQKRATPSDLGPNPPRRATPRRAKLSAFRHLRGPVDFGLIPHAQTRRV